MSHLISSHLGALHADSRRRIRALKHNSNVGYAISPGYTIRPAETKNEEPTIPSPTLFSGLPQNISQAPGPAAPRSAFSSTPASQENSSSGNNNEPSRLLPLPSVAECAVHLEMLEIFFSLRVRVIQSKPLDKTFGFEQKPRTVYRRKYDSKQRKYVNQPHTIKDSTWKTRRRDKWIVYLHVAVGRFMVWAKAADVDIFAAAQDSSVIELPHLPPCDILMLWHAFLLNPGDYKAYCDTQKLHWLYKVPFPWSRVHAAIDQRTLSYTLSEECQQWATAARIAPDLHDFLVQIGEERGPILQCLTVYGTLDIYTAWTQRPTIDITPSHTLLDLHRGFIDAFQLASNQVSQAQDLVSNVERQSAFVEKMHQQLWLRSPSVSGTLRRAVNRYDGFLQLFKLYPGDMLVPTLDIDLAWHTHQLSPQRYTLGTKKRAGRFINHDDKIAKGQLNTGMSKTKELFQIRFGENYDVCLCWDCEAVLDAIENADDEDMAQYLDLVTEVQKSVEYYRAVELARRKGGG